jgi:radical SAM protein with 4Fe4S-binding SPASM domain
MKNKYPQNIQIEITNYCNSKCIICPIKSMKRKRGIMEFKLFKKIIDDCKENKFKGEVLPFLNGETFLVPNVLDYLRYIRSHLPNSRIVLFSNASKMSSKISDKIIEENLLDVLVVSFDGGTKKAYESVRRGLSFEEVKNNVHYFIKKRNELNKRKPLVTISMVVTKENMNTRKKLKKEFIDADEIRFCKMFNFAGQLKKAKNNFSAIKNFFYKQNYCSRLADFLTILVDGDTALCCFDYEGKINLGNVKEHSIKEIWNGEKRLKILENLNKRKFKELPLCSDCDFINHNIITRQILKTEPKIRKNKWMYSLLKNLYIDSGIE